MFRLRNLIAAAAMLASAATLQAHEQRYQRPVDKTVRYQGGKVSIENSFGPVNVHQGDSGEVEVHAIVRASTQELENAIKVEISSSASGVTILADFPDQIH